MAIALIDRYLSVSGEQRFEASVRIQRPVEEVFAYVSDPENFPHWNSAVRTVRPTSASRDAVGSTYTITRDLPIGRA